MRKITGYILASAISAGLLAVPALAAGGVVNGVVRGAETALSDVGDAADDLVGGDNTSAGASSAPDVTDLEAEKTSATTAATTQKPGSNPATGATLGFAALGLSAAGIGLASRKKK